LTVSENGGESPEAEYNNEHEKLEKVLGVVDFDRQLAEKSGTDKPPAGNSVDVEGRSRNGRRNLQRTVKRTKRFEVSGTDDVGEPREGGSLLGEILSRKSP
jgi:hypothetical protein